MDRQGAHPRRKFGLAPLCASNVRLALPAAASHAAGRAGPAACEALPVPGLACGGPCPALPCPALPCPALPCPGPPLMQENWMGASPMAAPRTAA